MLSQAYTDEEEMKSAPQTLNEVVSRINFVAIGVPGNNLLNPADSVKVGKTTGGGTQGNCLQGGPQSWLTVYSR